MGSIPASGFPDFFFSVGVFAVRESKLYEFNCNTVPYAFRRNLPYLAHWVTNFVLVLVMVRKRVPVASILKLRENSIGNGLLLCFMEMVYCYVSLCFMHKDVNLISRPIFSPPVRHMNLTIECFVPRRQKGCME